MSTGTSTVIVSPSSSTILVVSPPSAGATDADITAAVAAHAADTTDIHGIADTSALLDTSDIGVTVQAYSAVLAATTASFTTADESKLDGIEAGADVTDATNVAAAGAVMGTLVDAKGDLLVATAADTVARLPVGATNGHVLTVDSAEAAGVKWAATSGGSSPPAFGRPGSATRYAWLGLNESNSTSGISTGSNAANRVFHIPAMLDHDAIVDAVAVAVTSAATSGSLLRLGACQANGNWQPLSGGTQYDWGTVAVDSTGKKEITFTELTLGRGRWLWMFETDASAPTLRVVQTKGPLGVFWHNGVGEFIQQMWTGVSAGAPAFTFGSSITVETLVNQAINCPVFFRLSSTT